MRVEVFRDITYHIGLKVLIGEFSSRCNMGTESAFSVNNDGRTSACALLLRDLELARDVGSLDSCSKGAAHVIIADATEVSDGALRVGVHLCTG